jgi:hypothetical protein
MKLPITLDGLPLDRVRTAGRTVPRVKRSLATSLCACASVSWVQVRRADAPFRYSEGCFCLSPEQHGAQFQGDPWGPGRLKGRC